jgi:hypothetical protein
MVPHLSHSSPYTPIIFTLVVAALIISIPLVNFLPMRTTFLVLGLTPFVLTHPFTRYMVYPLLLDATARHLVTLRVQFMRLVDNDRLEDKHWVSELKTVELWENERWAALAGIDDTTSLHTGWSKTNLRPGERKPWTRGRDGWSGVSDDGSGDVRSVLFRVSPSPITELLVGPSRSDSVATSHSLLRRGGCLWRLRNGGQI